MPQSLSRVWIHIVFSTKEPRPFLQHEGFRDQMFRMLAYHVNQTGCVSASVGGHVDHAHLLVGLSRTIAIAKLVETVKAETSRWAKTCDVGPARFTWQAGYGAFSVSQSLLDQVDQYIRNQEEHHAKLTYQDEFRRLCQRHGIEIDERYMRD